jgi:hypothetical protein
MVIALGKRKGEAAGPADAFAAPAFLQEPRRTNQQPLLTSQVQHCQVSDSKPITVPDSDMNQIEAARS